MNSMKKNNKTNVWIYWLIVWESGDSVSCTAHPKCVRSIEWSVDRVCVWARESRRAIGSRSVVCRIYVHDVYTKWSEPNESTRAAAAAVHSVKKEKDNIKIDDFNSVSIALPDSKLVNIVVFLPCIFVCDINAHRDFSSASTIRFFFRPVIVSAHARYEIYSQLFFSHSALFSKYTIFFPRFASFWFRLTLNVRTVKCD